MKIFILLKQVPDTETKIKLKPDGSGIDEAGIKWVVNPYDEFAIEEAIKTKEANPSAQIYAVSFGPKRRTADALRTALAMGADEAIAIDAEETADVWATAEALAKAIQKEGPADLIFSGKLAIDDNMSSVSQMVAELLDVPHATVVGKFKLNGARAEAERETEGGSREILDLALPCVVACNKGLNTPRYASLPGIMKAKKKPLKELSLADLGVSSAPRIRYKNFQLPQDRPSVKILSGDTAAAQLAQLLREEAKVI